MTQKLIDINEFMQTLKDNGLLIVSAAEFGASKVIELENRRKQYLKRPALTYKELLDLKLLPVNCKQSIDRWVERGKIKQEEVYVTKNGRKMILTSAIRRMGYAN